jgi:hypothetical protein
VTSTKKQRFARATGREHLQLQLDQSLELKRDFVIFAIQRMEQSAKMATSTMLRPYMAVACAR